MTAYEMVDGHYVLQHSEEHYASMEKPVTSASQEYAWSMTPWELDDLAIRAGAHYYRAVIDDVTGHTRVEFFYR